MRVSSVRQIAPALALLFGLLAGLGQAHASPGEAAPGGHGEGAPGNRVKTDVVRLLTSDGEIQSHTTADDLVAFIKTAQAKAYPILDESPAPAKVRVQFDCQPGQCDVELYSQGNARTPVLQALYDAMSGLAPLKCSGAASFQVQFSVGL